MNRCTTTIKGFSNYVIEITMGGLEWHIVDIRTGKQVPKAYSRRRHCTEYQLEDDTGVTQSVEGSVISQLIYPYLRDMCTHNPVSYTYPEIDLEGDIYVRYNGKWMLEKERVQIVMKEWEREHRKAEK